LIYKFVTVLSELLNNRGFSTAIGDLVFMPCERNI